MSRPEWLYGSWCCDQWTPGDGCSRHTGRPAMSLAARNLGAVLEAVISRRPCEVDTGRARTCGEPAVATAGGKRVCAGHRESAEAAAAYISDILRRRQ